MSSVDYYIKKAKELYRKYRDSDGTGHYVGWFCSPIADMAGIPKETINSRYIQTNSIYDSCEDFPKEIEALSKREAFIYYALKSKANKKYHPKFKLKG